MNYELVISVISLVFLLFGGLLGIIGYFLREMHKDFKGLRNDVVKIMNDLVRNEEKGKTGFNHLSVQLKSLEDRIDKIERKLPL
jgi:hypothetical protein